MKYLIYEVGSGAASAFTGRDVADHLMLVGGFETSGKGRATSDREMSDAILDVSQRFAGPFVLLPLSRVEATSWLRSDRQQVTAGDGTVI